MTQVQVAAMDDHAELLSDDEKSPCEYREDLFNTLCGDNKALAFTATMLPPKAQCPVCSKWFRDKTRVHEHLNVHYGARPLYCNVCGTTFAARSNLIKHAQQHHAPYTCYVCGHGPYADTRLLTEHTRNNHEELHRFACHLCDLSYPRQADLSEHLISHPPSLLEVRRRKRGAPDSPIDLSTDAEDLVAKRPNSNFANGSPSDDQGSGIGSGSSGNANVDYIVAKNSNGNGTDAYHAPAFFGLGLDAASMKHASMEELASQISKLTNFAANLQQNGMLHAFTNGGPFLQLPTFAHSSVPQQQQQQSLPLPQPQPQLQLQLQPHNTIKNEVNGSVKPEPAPAPAPLTNGALQNSKLPSILLRKQTATHHHNSHDRTAHSHGHEPHASENGLKATRDSRSVSGEPTSNSATRTCDLGTQCSLLDEQTALLSLPNVAPCQREILVFQQLLTKLVSRGDVFRCQHCEIIFFERGIYCLHRSLHDEHNPFQCAICGKRCTNKDNFTLHFVNQKHQTGGCTGACITLPPHDELTHMNTNGK